MISAGDSKPRRLFLGDKLRIAFPNQVPADMHHPFFARECVHI
jgi:hypothetical protein